MPNSESNTDTAGILSRKERERLGRRADIVNAAMAVFAYRGFADATLEEIAEKAEYGKGTIYSYFQGKEDLFDAVLDEGMNRLIELARRSCSTSASGFETCYKEFAREFLSYVFEHSALSALIMREAHKPGRQTVLKARFPELIEALRLPLPERFRLADGSTVDSRQIAYMFLTMVFALYQISMPENAVGCAVSPGREAGARSMSGDESIQMLLGVIDLTFLRGILPAETPSA
ncbi:MAG: TetR/AcrR family transcriptional regulator [Ignavibacteria bacterium]|nr:TetR/AcrR family transcriptional regulator [Ignavibacteria bacterium]